MHKPDIVKESKRILRSGGEIRYSNNTQDSGGPGTFKIFAKNQEQPGLALSRSMGDQVTHTVGVTS